MVFELLEEFGGEPSYESWGILSNTICHNKPGEGSRKLYYYYNSGLFQCFTNCGSYDVFELVIKVSRIQWGKEYDLNDAIRYIAIKFGLAGESKIEDNSLIDWKTFDNYDRLQDIDVKDYHIVLKEYDSQILDNLNYNVVIEPWLREGISQEVMRQARIGYFPPGAQITIPHYDINGRFVGLRGRALCAPDIEAYGKYRPMVIGRKQFNHPLGMNLYGLNDCKDNIKKVKKAIIFEGEKSVLKFKSYFGTENNIAVACCGSSISAYQVQLLLDCGVQEIIVAFDRQFQKIGDDEYIHLKNNLIKINNRYKNYVDLSFIFDKKMITGYKDAPVDCNEEVFLRLWRERIKL